MRESVAKPAPAIEQLLAAMEQWGASDLFLCVNKVPAVRLHGAVLALEVPATTAQDVERFLSVAVGDAKRRELEKTGELDVGYTLPGGRRFRLSVAKQLGAPSIFARALPNADRTLNDLGLPAMLGAFAEHAHGLVLVAGPSGSGKSTALAALVHQIHLHRALHIVTIEEPVEFLHGEGRGRVTQREVGADVPSFAVALRQAQRESPDAIMVSNLSEPATIRAALDAALRGQLVLAGMTASNACRALQQLTAGFAESERAAVADDVAQCLRGVAALRLCTRKDVAGRIAAVETVAAGAVVNQLIREQRWVELEELIYRDNFSGVVSFDSALEALCRQGLISPDVALAHASSSDAVARRLRSMGATDATPLTAIDIHHMLRVVVKRGASDLHLSVGRPPILRVNGSLEADAGGGLARSDVDAVLRSLMSARQRDTYEQDKELDFALSLPDGKRFRANAYYERGQPAVAFRSIRSEIPDAAALGLPPAVQKMGEEPHGLLLVVGPTGSGKTTTLACLVDRINHTRPCHVITVEDPIEYVHKSDRSTIHQREVGSDTESFSAALKYILRQDPDVVLIGELRDLETIAAALTAAETGHLVLATLHTNDAVQTIDRIIDVFPPHQQAQTRSQLAAALIGVVSQRLLPRADGQGRTAAFEVMVASAAIRTLVREAKMHQALGIMQTARAAGMVTMDQSLEELLRRGVIDKDEAVRYMQNPANLDKPRPKAQST